jgi:hypothetical protein
LNFLDIRLAAIGAGTLAGLAWAVLFNGTTATLTLFGTWDGRDTALLLLEICQTTSLGMDILDLAGGLGVEVNKLLSRRRTSSLFVVGSQSREQRIGFLGNTVGLINGASLLGSVVFFVEASDSGDETG